MFYLKVMNPEDLDYSMHSANTYRVASRYSGSIGSKPNEPSTSSCERYIYLDESIDVHPRMLDVSNNDVFIMNADGKTIDKIYCDNPRLGIAPKPPMDCAG
jgi:hypothetical protein